MENKNIYSDIFDIVSGNMKNEGKEFSFSRECYLCNASADPVNTDILALSEIKDNRRFLEIAYSMLLKRGVDDNAVKCWEGRFGLPSRDFQKLVIRSILKSAEYQASHVRALNNIYSENVSYGTDISGVRRNSSVTMPEKIMSVYRRMPEPLKKAARKMMGVK